MYIVPKQWLYWSLVSHSASFSALSGETMLDISKIEQRRLAFLQQPIPSSRSIETIAKDVGDLLAEVARLRTALPQEPKPKPFIATIKPTPWWICFSCWIAYYVPTTGIYGDCQQCGKPTVAWPLEPETSLSMLEMTLRPVRAGVSPLRSEEK